MKKAILIKIADKARNLAKSLPRYLPVILMLCFYSLNAFGADPFETATGQISGYISSVKKLLYAIAAIIALVGAFNVYHKMTNGDQDVKKTIMLTLGGCIAMLALSEALPAFFGHTAAGVV